MQFHVHIPCPPTQEQDPGSAGGGFAGLTYSLQLNSPQVQLQLQPQGALANQAAAERGTASAGNAAQDGPRRRSKWTPDSLAERRKERSKIRRLARNSADDWMRAAEGKFFSVSYLLVAGAGGLTAAAALQAIWQACERAYYERGEAWVFRTEQEWLDATGLIAEEWLDGRHALREQGFVKERRRFDLDAGEIITELAFDAEQWARRLAELRQEAQDHFRNELESQAGLLQSHFAD